MAENRFKKSVDSATKNTTEIIKDDAIDNIQDNATKSISLDVKNDILKIIFDKNKKDKGGNHTIYLSAEVGEALNKLVKKSKQSKSTLVNDILETVFKGNGIL